MQNLVFKSLIIFALSNIGSVLSKDCLGRDQCSCQYDDDQSIVDLTSIGSTDSTPRFQDVSSSDGNTYSYNPCYPFSENGECNNAAACMKDSVQTTSMIGTAQSARFGVMDGTLVVAYTAGSGILTATEVILACDQHACTPSLKADGKIGGSSYQLTLTTVCACPNGCTADGPVNCNSSGGFSKGGVFLIILFTLVLVYVVGGTLFMKFGKKAQGSEIIPNVSFWKAIPSLIKDGFKFTLSPCLRKMGKYNEI